VSQRTRALRTKGRGIAAKGHLNRLRHAYDRAAKQALNDIDGSEKAWSLWLRCKGLPVCKEFTDGSLHNGAIAHAIRVDTKLVLVGRNYEITVPTMPLWTYYSDGFKREMQSTQGYKTEVFVVEAFVLKGGRWHIVRLADVAGRIEAAITLAALGGTA
jgi:hypothetical protein